MNRYLIGKIKCSIPVFVLSISVLSMFVKDKVLDNQRANLKLKSNNGLIEWQSIVNILNRHRPDIKRTIDDCLLLNDPNFTSKNYYYVDFDDDNGFAVFDNEHFYEHSEKGNYPAISTRNLYYNPNDGFLIFDKERNLFLQYDIENDEPLFQGKEIKSSRPHIDSVFSNKDGGIFESDLPSYVAEIHPSWEKVSSASITNFTCLSQNKTSFYLQYYHYYVYLGNGSFYVDDVYKSGEGNCVPTAIFNYLYNLPSTTSPGLINYSYCQSLLTGRNTTDRSCLFDGFSTPEDVLFSSFGDNIYLKSSYSPEIMAPQHYLSNSYDVDFIGIHFQSIGETNNSYVNYLHSTDLYWQIRDRAINFGFNPKDGMYDSYVPDIINDVSGLYGYDIMVSPCFGETNAINNINYGIPVIIGVEDSKTYHDHEMVIIGYNRYKETILGTTFYYYIWKVADGHSEAPRYYDPYHGSSLNMYFCTNRNTLVWPGC